MCARRSERLGRWLPPSTPRPKSTDGAGVPGTCLSPPMAASLGEGLHLPLVLVACVCHCIWLLGQCGQALVFGAWDPSSLVWWLNEVLQACPYPSPWSLWIRTLSFVAKGTLQT